MTNVKPATDEDRKLSILFPPEDLDEARGWIARLEARLDADREEPRALRQAIGMLTTLHPTMVMDPLNPVGMALQVHAHVTQEIAALKKENSWLRLEQGHSVECYEAPQREIAQLKGENAQLIEAHDHAQTGLKSMRAEANTMREEIAYLKARSERDMCADGHERIRYTPDEDFGPCPLCLCWSEVAALKARDAEWESKARNWMASPEAAEQLEGYRRFGQRAADAENARDIALDEVAALGTALAQMEERTNAEIAALKADQSDWRKGVGFIASALGIDSLSCVDIAERGLEIRAERDALKAEVERLTPAFLPCHVCGGKGISDIIHGAVVRCENCDGTGRAR